MLQVRNGLRGSPSRRTWRGLFCKLIYWPCISFFVPFSQEYSRRLSEDASLSQDTIHGLFLNLNSIVDFARRFLIGVETNACLPPEQQRFGSLFLLMVSLLLPLPLYDRVHAMWGSLRHADDMPDCNISCRRILSSFTKCIASTTSLPVTCYRMSWRVMRMYWRGSAISWNRTNCSCFILSLFNGYSNIICCSK